MLRVGLTANKLELIKVDNKSENAEATAAAIHLADKKK